MMMAKTNKKLMSKKAILAASTLATLLFPSCSSVKSVLAVDPTPAKQGPILNPFEGYGVNGPETKGTSQNIVLRTKKGERSIEVELPASQGALSDFTIPVSPAFRDQAARSPASGLGEGFMDERYRERTPSLSDREIASTLPRATAEDEGQRREIETGLGLSESQEGVPDTDRSYLAAMDHVKQLYRAARFEAALIEIDELVRTYPTDARLYEMRGTLLDRMGRGELALRSWNQALRLNPGNESLRRFVERKQQKRSLASP
jgi:hypothetical protein